MIFIEDSAENHYLASKLKQRNMKKLFFFSLAVVLTLSISSCGKESYDLPDGDIVTPIAIDLGIRVDGKTIKWASFNLGATAEQEAGYFYAWGSTIRKTEYLWKSYPYSNSDGTKFMKYCLADEISWWGGEGTPDGFKALQVEDDIVAKKLGGKWRMPTEKEAIALIATLSNTSRYTWDFHAQSGGVYGAKVTQKATGNSIFLPYTGLMNGNKSEFAGIRGFFWTSTLSKGATGGPDGAFNLGIDINDEGAGIWSNSRCYGFPIRPVYVME